MDEINRRYGRHTIRYGSVDTEGKWQMKAAHKSPRYTTNIGELMIIDVDKPIAHVTIQVSSANAVSDGSRCG